jgi:hypothetical protein
VTIPILVMTRGSDGIKRGKSVILVVRGPWQRTGTASAGGDQNPTRINLPEACVGVFESVLDHTAPVVNREPTCGFLELKGLQLQIVEGAASAGGR